MELLPDAERLRRGLMLASACSLVMLEAIFPQVPVEAAVDRAVAPLAEALAPLAGLPLRGWDRLGRSPVASPPTGGLAEAEEALGRPPAVPGLRWVAVPVLSREGASWTLGAGRAFGLAEGQAVVFGRSWLGRVHDAGEQRATLRLWTAPGEGTGARLGRGENALRALCEGRGYGEEALVRFPEPGGEPRDGEEVNWRRRSEDPPSLEGLGLQLGTLRRRGDEPRRSAYWAVEPRLPAGAEGRVFVALGALPERPLREAERYRRPARVVLPVDGVCGERSAAVELSEAVPAVAVGGRDGLRGIVQRRRGRLSWMRRTAPEDWGAAAVAVLPSGRIAAPREPSASSGTPALVPGTWLYTRGGPTMPRGLPIGPVGGPVLRLGDELEGYWR